MKKAILILLCVLLLLTAIYPAGVIITAYFGYSFELISVPAFAITLAVLSVCTVILGTAYKGTIDNKAIRVLLSIITPLSLINAVFYIAESPQIWVIVSGIISAICSCCLSIEYGRPLALKIVALLLSALMIWPVGFCVFIAVAFGNFTQERVVEIIESPG